MKRVHYFTGQLLSAADFQAEQEYHLARQRRLNLRLHGMGIVSGLQVSTENDGIGIHVSPGVAIDPLGNEIVVGEPQVVPFPTGADRADLVIYHIETLTDPVPSNDAPQPSRVEEGFRLEVVTDPESRSSECLILARLAFDGGRWTVRRPFHPFFKCAVVALVTAVLCRQLQSPRRR